LWENSKVFCMPKICMTCSLWNRRFVMHSATWIATSFPKYV
jgi:hypothetical protein